MIKEAFTLSLIITAIYSLFCQGMLLGFVRIASANVMDRWLGIKWSRYIQKPLWDCLICMSSVWVIIITLDFNIELMLLVCGINTLIDKILDDESIAGG